MNYQRRQSVKFTYLNGKDPNMLVSKTYSDIIDHDCLPSIKVFAIGEDAISAMNSVFDLYEGCINYIAMSDNLNELTSSKANIQMQVENNDSAITAKANHEELISKLKSLVKETDLAIIIADMQKALYSRLAAEIAKASIAEDNLTVGIENSATHERNSKPNILDFEKALDAVININDGIIDLDKNSDDKTIASELIEKAVNTIVYPLVYISFIVVDFNDLKSLLKNSGKNVVATLKSSDISKLKVFVEKLHLKPKGTLFYISTNSNFLTADYEKLLDEIECCFDDDCKEHVCLHLDDSVPKDTFNISVLFSGL